MYWYLYDANDDFQKLTVEKYSFRCVCVFVISISRFHFWSFRFFQKKQKKINIYWSFTLSIYFWLKDFSQVDLVLFLLISISFSGFFFLLCLRWWFEFLKPPPQKKVNYQARNQPLWRLKHGFSNFCYFSDLNKNNETWKASNIDRSLIFRQVFPLRSFIHSTNQSHPFFVFYHQTNKTNLPYWK